MPRKPYAIAGALRDEVIALAREKWPALDPARVVVLKAPGLVHMIGRRYEQNVGTVKLRPVGPYHMAFRSGPQVLSVLLPRSSRPIQTQPVCGSLGPCADLVEALRGRNVQGLVWRDGRLVYRKAHKQLHPQPVRFCPWCGQSVGLVESGALYAATHTMAGGWP